jgi:hypothetical protein
MKYNYLKKKNVIIFMTVLFFSIIYYHYFYKFKEGKPCVPSKSNNWCKIGEKVEDLASDGAAIISDGLSELQVLEKIINAIKDLKNAVSTTLTSMRGMPGKFDIPTGGGKDGGGKAGKYGNLPDIVGGKTNDKIVDKANDLMSDMGKNNKKRQGM